MKPAHRERYFTEYCVVGKRLCGEACGGGYVWLVWYNHEGAHRRWHGISTAIDFET